VEHLVPSSRVCRPRKNEPTSAPSATTEISSAVLSTVDGDFTFAFPSTVCPRRSSEKTVASSVTRSLGTRVGTPSSVNSSALRRSTIAASCSAFATTGIVTKLNRRFSADDMSLTPRSRVFAVAITAKPRRAGTTSSSSGTATCFSDNTEIKASCTSAAQRVSSSSLTTWPCCMPRRIGLSTSARRLGPSAINSA